MKETIAVTTTPQAPRPTASSPLPMRAGAGMPPHRNLAAPPQPALTPAVPRRDVTVPIACMALALAALAVAIAFSAAQGSGRTGRLGVRNAQPAADSASAGHS